MYKNLDRFCLSETPPLFVGPTITSSPLEKINDLLKQQIVHSSHPRFVVTKAEFLVKKSLKYCIALEKSKLAEVHKDINLLDVQRHVSAKILKLFYSNYIEASQVFWTEDVKELHKYHLETSHPDEGTHYCRSEEEDFQLCLNYCACNLTIKSGIPCIHLISLRIQLKLPYLPNFNKRWIVQGKDEGEPVEE